MLSLDAYDVPIVFRIKVTLTNYFDGEETHASYEYANTTMYGLPGDEARIQAQLVTALANQGITVDPEGIEVYPA